MAATSRTAERSWIDTGIGLLAVLCVAAIALPSHALSLTRGPYLQMGTSTTQVLRWRTDLATDSAVRLGTAPAALNTLVSAAASTTEHEVRVTGLVPGTVYYYSVGSTTATRITSSSRRPRRARPSRRESGCWGTRGPPDRPAPAPPRPR